MISNIKRILGGRIAVYLVPLLLFGCQADKMTRDPAATQPVGRDLDREGVQTNRRLMTLSESTIRIYDAPDGQFVVDERQTFGHPGLLQYLERQDAKTLRSGIVYFVSQGDIKDRATFAAVKDFCVRRNVDLYLGEGGWSRRKPKWMLDPAVHDDVTWIVQARP
jgi:hypothetical protein